MKGGDDGAEVENEDEDDELDEYEFENYDEEGMNILKSL